jgi:hypothetical protein
VADGDFIHSEEEEEDYVSVTKKVVLFDKTAM